jgi:uncharacterized LabA/DUF88 family protein
MYSQMIQRGHCTVYVYVDGESNYIRTDSAIKSKFGNEVGIADVEHVHDVGMEGSYPDPGPVLRHNGTCQFFWDTGYGRMLRGPIERQTIAKVYYFGGIQGDDDAVHAASIFMRSNGCMPMVVRESLADKGRRQNRGASRQLIEKPKGVDALLVATLLDDAYRGNFDACVLLTSDSDYVPAIEIVQRLGKPVLVFGFGSGLGVRSRLLHVPDVFLDLEPYVQTSYRQRGSAHIDHPIPPHHQ